MFRIYEDEDNQWTLHVLTDGAFRWLPIMSVNAVDLDSAKAMLSIVFIKEMDSIKKVGCDKLSTMP